MANQTVTTVVNYDDDTISGLLNGETLTINGGSVTVDADVRWNQQAAVFGAVTLSSTLGGAFLIDGTKVWEVPFSASSGNVPTQAALGSNGVTGGTSGATGELTRVWAAGSLTPATAGDPMPATGFIKLRSKTGNFQSGETITLPGGATVTASGAGKRSWINVVGREATGLTIPRLGDFQVEGDWYDLGTTDGTDGQTFQLPVADECPALQVETAPGSGVYEWWLNAGAKWFGFATAGFNPSVAGGNTTITASAEPAPVNASDPYGFLHHAIRVRETTANGIHIVTASVAANAADLGVYTFRTYLKKETRRYAIVQAAVSSDTIRYGALIDLDNGTVVSNPTVGSPSNTSTTVTDVGGGWYLVELTLEHVALNLLMNIKVGTSNSASPTLVNGLPSFVGSTTEGVYVSEMQIVAPASAQFIEDDDVRGKYYFSNPDTGQIIFAQRTGKTAGYKPASGCKVRIPNVILSSAAAVDYARNTLNIGAGTRYDTTTTAAGSIVVKNAVCNWYISGSSAFSVDLRDSAFWAVSLSNTASTTDILNCGFGASRDISIQPVTIANSFSGGSFTDVRAFRTTTGITIGFATCAEFDLTRVQAECGGYLARPTRGTLFISALAFSFSACADITLQDCTAIGGGVGFLTVVRATVNNISYADKLFGDGDLVNPGHGIYIASSSSNIFVDGFSAYGNLPNLAPAQSIFTATSNCDSIEFRNVGTAAAPYDCGNLTANPLAISGTVTNATFRRIYTENVRTAAITVPNTNQNIKFINVWGDGGDPQRIQGVAVTSQGCRWSNNNAVESAVYGTHWEDAFTSATSGRITIYGNEPLVSTANQCSFTFGANAGFTSAGGASMPNVGDEVVWTMPYYAIGHTGIAQFGYGTSTTETWFMTGVNQQNFEFEYQIDKNDGNGFSAWKPMLNIARRALGGGLGTNTVTLTSADWDAMTTRPQVGDFVTTATTAAPTAKLPAGTTITDITGYVLTFSENFTTALTANELLYFWKDLADEVIDAQDGYKLKVKARVNTALETNLFSYLRIPFDTTSSAQQAQYPLPTTQNTGRVTNIRAGSRIRVFNVTTNTEIANEIVSGTTWTYLYDEGTDFTDGDIINVRLARCLGATASIGYEGTAIAGSTGWALFAAQDDDLVYNANGIDGTAITEFVFDYPNIQVDINDADGQTTIPRLYAWWANERTTEQGIRTLIGGLVAEDTANYKVISSVVDLKLDNTASTGVLFTGDFRLYRDDGAAPVVSSTSGGGSITLYAGKVYTSVVSTASPVITGDISDVPTAIENAAAVLAAAQSTPIYSEIRRVNGVAVDGTGTDLDPWGPVG